MGGLEGKRGNGWPIPNIGVGELELGQEVKEAGELKQSDGKEQFITRQGTVGRARSEIKLGRHSVYLSLR
jgi:hypothetical protein